MDFLFPGVNAHNDHRYQDINQKQDKDEAIKTRVVQVDGGQ